MADELDKSKDPNSDASGAGTKAHKAPKTDPATLPGGDKFDVEGASSDEFDKHFEILQRRQKLAGLAPAAPAAEVAATPLVAAAPLAPNPGDIRAMKDGEERYFDPITWDLLGEGHAGWVETVAKPANVQQ